MANVTAIYHNIDININIEMCWIHCCFQRCCVALSPGASANMDRDSPVEARAVTSDRRRVKYCERIVTVGRNVRQ